jgi:DNA-binding beta-propeller fold protein YncE
MRTATLTLASVLTVGVASGSALLQEPKGGEEETGHYAVVANWPQPWSETGYLWGSNAGVFAQSPDRIFLAVRGELKTPSPTPRNWLGFWGSRGERATVPKPELRNCIVVLDRNGKAIERWTQWDHLFQINTPPSGTQGDYFAGPHKIKISPYGPARHVWVVNELKHEIYKFTNDGKELVMTLGVAGIAADDDKHFGQPQDIAWLPDGTLLVADGLINSRVVKFDKDGKFLGEWGTKGNAPGQFSGPHAIATDRNRRVYVADRGNRRVQIFDEHGKFLDVWPNLRQANDLYVGADQQVWVLDGVNSRLLQFDPQGRLQYWWGTHGAVAGAFWEGHQMSVDSDGNVYVADSYHGRAQKFTPKPGADGSKLLSPPRTELTP